jgi:hypothetical protein
VIAARLRELLDACEEGESPPLELDAV